MSEPEEELDEEWIDIAEVMGAFEKQFLLARKQTANGGGASSAMPQLNHAQPTIQPSPPPPSAQARFQAQPSRKRGRTSTPMHPTISTHPRNSVPPASISVSASVPPPVLPQQPLQPVGPPQQHDRTVELSRELSNIQSENRRIKMEYTTRIRHLEARLSKSQESSMLRSRVNLLERELRDARSRTTAAGPVAATQGEVVEGTQTGLEVLKASIKPKQTVKESVVFGGWGIDRSFMNDLIRKKLFAKVGEALVRYRVCVNEIVAGDWVGVATGLVDLLDGEGWNVGLAGLSVVLCYSRSARGVMMDVGTVRKVLSTLTEHSYEVLDGVLLGCVEQGPDVDAVRREVLLHEVLLRSFRQAERGAGRVLQSAIACTLECEEQRVGDEEWGRLETIVQEAVKLVHVPSVGDSCLDILGCCAVLAGDVVVRHGGVEALLNVVVEGVMGGEERRMRKALLAVKECFDGYDVKVRSGVKMVALPALIELVRKEDSVSVACDVTAALLNL